MGRAAELSQLLADRIDQLVVDVLPGGRREGREWRAGSVAGEQGASLRVHLAGDKRGHWCDFATGLRGDALDLVREALGPDIVGAMLWARDWLANDRSSVLPQSSPGRAPAHGDAWRRPWGAAVPIAGTLAERYLYHRGLKFDDPDGASLRFAPRRARRHPETGSLEYHPALLALLRAIHDGEPVGIINVFLRHDGTDRLRDRKGKTVAGAARGAAVMLSPFHDVTMGLVICEGLETGIAILDSGLTPVWACGGAGNLAAFPLLGGIEALTIAADADDAGRKASEAVATRWHCAGREVITVAPPVGDWADDEVAP